MEKTYPNLPSIAKLLEVMAMCLQKPRGASPLKGALQFG